MSRFKIGELVKIIGHNVYGYVIGYLEDSDVLIVQFFNSEEPSNCSSYEVRKVTTNDFQEPNQGRNHRKIQY
jgi:hypothetical protein